MRSRSPAGNMVFPGCGLAGSLRASALSTRVVSLDDVVTLLRPASFAAQADGAADKARATDERHAAIAAYDRSIKINETLQKRLLETR